MNQGAVWNAAYAPFGRLASAAGAPMFDGQFPGQYFDSESSLSYNYFRAYDPSLGRYVRSDPIGLRGGLNTYGYVNGNPLVGYDPLGLYGFDFEQFAEEVRQNRLDNALALGGLAATLSVGTIPKRPSELRGLGVPKEALNPTTGQLSRWAKRLGVRSLRIAGRTAVGIGVGAVATGTLVFEGFYDWGVIGRAAWRAATFDDGPSGEEQLGLGGSEVTDCGVDE